MKIIKYFIVFLALGMYPRLSQAQLAPMGAVYFQNQYLNNPSFAGLERGLTLDLGFRQQWGNLPGAPDLKVLTASYGMTSKAGLGLNVYHDQIGLFKRTRLMGTYAYHLPLNDNDQKLNFGVSLGFIDEMIDYARFDGDMGDLSVTNLNQRQKYMDGDFGVSYTDERLNIQAAMPNLRENLGFSTEGQEVVDAATFFVAASYKLRLPAAWDANIEPKIAYRGVKGYDGIFDAGANLTLAEDKIGVMVMYHSTKSASFGFSAKLLKWAQLMGYYTSNTGALAGQTNGNFEVNLRVNLFHKP